MALVLYFITTIHINTQSPGHGSILKVISEMYKPAGVKMSGNNEKWPIVDNIKNR